MEIGDGRREGVRVGILEYSFLGGLKFLLFTCLLVVFVFFSLAFEEGVE
jgi:hypothetical protein